MTSRSRTSTSTWIQKPSRPRPSRTARAAAAAAAAPSRRIWSAPITVIAVVVAEGDHIGVPHQRPAIFEGGQLLGTPASDHCQVLAGDRGELLAIARVQEVQVTVEVGARFTLFPSRRSSDRAP